MPTPRLTDDDLRRTLDVLAEAGGNAAEAARRLGLHKNSMYARLRDAALRGVDGSVPRTLPPGQIIKGVSTLYDRNGQVAATWVKSRTDDGEDRDEWLEAAREVLSQYAGVAGIAPRPSAIAVDLLTFLGFADLHLGLKAWGAETGEDFDLAIAKRLLLETAADLLAQTPPSKVCALVFMGDTTHADNHRGETEKSKNRLDVDTRHSKVRIEAADAAIKIVDLARRRHGRVIVRFLPGNHDPETAGALALALFFAFKDDPRVEIDLDPGMFWFLAWGAVLLGAGHGHTFKIADFPGIMATHPKARRHWSAAKWCRGFTAHVHHHNGIEKGGVRVISLNTIAARDAFHAGGPYSSDRILSAFIYHRTLGPRGAIEIAVPSASAELEPGVAA